MKRETRDDRIFSAMTRLLASGSLTVEQARRYQTQTYMSIPTPEDVTEYISKQEANVSLKLNILDEVLKRESSGWVRMEIDIQMETLRQELMSLQDAHEFWAVAMRGD